MHFVKIVFVVFQVLILYQQNAECCLGFGTLIFMKHHLSQHSLNILTHHLLISLIKSEWSIAEQERKDETSGKREELWERIR